MTLALLLLALIKSWVILAFVAPPYPPALSTPAGVKGSRTALFGRRYLRRHYTPQGSLSCALQHLLLQFCRR